MWTLDEAVELVRELRPKLRLHHLAITGSVLFNGESKKDLDLIVFPNSTIIDEIPSTKLIDYLGFTNAILCNHDEYDEKTVYRCNYKGRRVDVFFMK